MSQSVLLTGGILFLMAMAILYKAMHIYIRNYQDLAANN